MKTLPPLVGMVGPAGSGKDAAAAVLVAQGWRRVAFAEPLRELCLAIDPLVSLSGQGEPVVRLSAVVASLGWDVAKRLTDVRRLLQRVGTEGVRHVIGPDTWTGLAERTITELREAGLPVVVSDVRFSNEAELVRRLGGKLLAIRRPARLRLDSALAAHPSEQHLATAEAEWRILNDGTLDDLGESVLLAVRAMFGKRATAASN